MRTLTRLLLWVMLGSGAFAQAPLFVHSRHISGGGGCGTPGSITDNFVGSAGTPLATHNPCWLNLSGTYVVSALQLGSTSGTVVPTGIFALAGALYQGDTSDVSQAVQNPPTTTNISVQGPVVRATQNVVLGYWGVLNNISGGSYVNACIYKAGASQLCNVVSFSTSAPHTLRLVAAGTGTVTIGLYIDGSGTPSVSITDSTSPYNSGTPGIVIQANNHNVLDTIMAAPWKDF